MSILDNINNQCHCQCHNHDNINVSVVFLLWHLLNLKSKQITRNCPLIWHVKMWSLTLYVISLVYSCTRSSGEAREKRQQADEIAFCAVNLQSYQSINIDEMTNFTHRFGFSFLFSLLLFWSWTTKDGHETAHTKSRGHHTTTSNGRRHVCCQDAREFSPLCIGTRFFFMKTYKILSSCLWGVYLTHPVLAALCGEFLLHIPCWLLFFLCGEFFLHVVVELKCCFACWSVALRPQKP